jgi:shikimate kinase
MNKIYLVGLPGAGKSHCGRWLAKQLNWNFEDLDHMIEISMDKRIAEVFDEHGEAIFRDVETEELHKTASMQNTVISCGGGTPIWKDNMDWMLRHGLTVYMNTPIDRIVGRILRNSQKRPLFKGMNEPEIKTKLYEIAEKRGEFYSRAKLIWNKDLPDARLYDAVNQLLALYSARF